MKLILREDVDHLGKVGELVTVADGYGRNFLLPRSKAVRATAHNVQQVEHHKRVIAAEQAKLKGEAMKVVDSLKSVALTLTVQAGEEGKLFGSVTTKDIEEALQSKGVMLSRKQILLAEPIKQVGEYTVNVKLHSEVTTPIKLSIVAKAAPVVAAKPA